MSVKTHKQRVIEEKKELDEKIKRLKIFQSTAVYRNLERVDQTSLGSQLLYMQGYSEALETRIKRF